MNPEFVDYYVIDKHIALSTANGTVQAFLCLLLYKKRVYAVDIFLFLMLCIVGNNLI